ncbi:histidine phosphotransferase family protein [Oceanibaculum sp.]|uniref:histidine phosphotransferase family protein n=1 Tax=Oceanibaculum sp. TaxID=1903597 RepID=UPI00258F6822|nr:histidine phosphotransferase family protein [Oceanibaculum sp.]MCH2395926.1 histidine phosphotransferase family protein [Oceanibaculum sp.]
MQIESRVMDLLISRLCHDLISPAGAIVNGIELVEEFGGEDMAGNDMTGDDMTGEAMALVGRSARQLSAKLSLFRVTFGSSGERDNFPAEECRRLLEAYLQEGKVRPDWALDRLPAGPGAARLVLLLAIIAAESLPRGGVLRLDGGDGNAVLQIRAAGADARLEGGTEAALLAGMTGAAVPEDLDPRAAPAYLAGLIAARRGEQIRIAKENGAIILTV